MRAFAFLLLGLLALTGAQPACATIAEPAHLAATTQMMGAHAACPDADRHDAHRTCVTASCLGCALPVARAMFPAPPLALLPARLTVGVATPLVGIDPVAAIPPPRPLA